MELLGLAVLVLAPFVISVYNDKRRDRARRAELLPWIEDQGHKARSVLAEMVEAREDEDAAALWQLHQDLANTAASLRRAHRDLHLVGDTDPMRNRAAALSMRWHDIEGDAWALSGGFETETTLKPEKFDKVFKKIRKQVAEVDGPIESGTHYSI